jgi:hypothetical protein
MPLHPSLQEPCQSEAPIRMVENQKGEELFGIGVVNDRPTICIFFHHPTRFAAKLISPDGPALDCWTERCPAVKLAR